MDKSPIELYNNYKVCALHFDHRMFTNHLKNRLLPSANPTIFVHMEGTSGLKRNLMSSAEREPPKKILVLSGKVIRNISVILTV